MKNKDPWEIRGKWGEPIFYHHITLSPILPTVYILLLLEMPHPHFRTMTPVSYYHCVLSHYFLSLPTLPHPCTCTCTILIFHSMTYTVSILPLSHTSTFWSYFVLPFTLPWPPFSQWFHTIFHITHTAPIVTIITYTLLTSPLLSHCHSTLSPSLYQTCGPVHSQLDTWCPSPAIPFSSSLFSSFPSLHSNPHIHTLS